MNTMNLGQEPFPFHWGKFLCEIRSVSKYWILLDFTKNIHSPICSPMNFYGILRFSNLRPFSQSMLCNCKTDTVWSLKWFWLLVLTPQFSTLNFPGCQAVILAQEVLSRDYIAKTIIWINWLLAASSCFLIITVVKGEREVFLPHSVLSSSPL